MESNSNLATQLFELIGKDKEYLNKYNKRVFEDEVQKDMYNYMVENAFKWRNDKLEEKQIEKLINSKDRKIIELLRIEDLYSDELLDLEMEHFNISQEDITEEKIEQLYQDEVLDEILQDEKASQQIKDCIALYRDAGKISREIYKRIYEDTDKERVCAIYNRHSTDKQKLEEMREKLIKYCKEELKIDKFVIFEEVGSVLEERKEFNNMVERINNGEFTDLLVYHPDRIYKASYDEEKFNEIITNIGEKVSMYSILNT